MKFCAVIPAAGRGSRLGEDIPKILVPVVDNLTILDFLYEKLSPFVDRVHIVASPSGLPLVQEKIAARGSVEPPITVSVQQEPRGMGDAIFGAYEDWKGAENILIMWGDQLHVSEQTIAFSRKVHLESEPPTCTLPLVVKQDLYVEYVLTAEGGLGAILQSREGDVCNPSGHSDVGTFLLTVDGLYGLWEEYLESSQSGALTNEVNFLPFLVFLSDKGWHYNHIPVEDPDENRGINTQEDLQFFRELYSSKSDLKYALKTSADEEGN